MGAIFVLDFVGKSIQSDTKSQFVTLENIGNFKKAFFQTILKSYTRQFRMNLWHTLINISLFLLCFTAGGLERYRTFLKTLLKVL